MIKLSIVIPTHNRQEYAEETVRAIINNLCDTEVIVVDSSPINKLDEALSDLIESKRVKLVWKAENINCSVIDNFNHSVEYISGSYVIFLGDDDLVHPDVFKVIAWAEKNNIEAINSSLPGSYYWPNFFSKIYKDGYASKLTLQNFNGKYKILNGKKEFKKACKNFGGGPLQMPRAYLGLISKKLIDRTLAKYSKLFGGVSPDIFSACLLSNEVKNYCSVDYPFIIPGSTAESTSGKSAEGYHKGSLRDNDHIRPFKNLIWDTSIPEIYSVSSVWGFSMLEACKKLSLNSTLNFPRLYIKSILRTPEFYKEIFFAAKKYFKGNFNLISIFYIFDGLFNEIIFFLQKLTKKIFTLNKATAHLITYSDINNPDDCIDALNKHLSNNKINLDLSDV